MTRDHLCRRVIRKWWDVCRDDPILLNYRVNVNYRVNELWRTHLGG